MHFPTTPGIAATIRAKYCGSALSEGGSDQAASCDFDLEQIRNCLVDRYFGESTKTCVTAVVISEPKKKVGLTGNARRRRFQRDRAPHVPLWLIGEGKS